MLAIREEELNMVNGGFNLSQKAGLVGLYRPKFAVGERVMSKSEPDLGIGTVADIEFHDGYFYTVQMNGGMLYTSEDDLEYPIMK